MAKDSGEVAVRPNGEHWPRARRAAEVATWVRRGAAAHPERIVCEATGGYEVGVVSALAASALPGVVVTPRQVRDFAKATARRAKTDRPEAAVLAAFGWRVRPAVRPLADELPRELQGYLARQRQWIEMLGAEPKRLPLAHSPVRADSETPIVWLQQRLHATDQQLRARLRASPVWRQPDDLLQSIPGVGPLTSASCWAQLPKLGTRNRREIAALVGIAPFNRARGTLAGHRPLWGGPAAGRRGLYRATVSATRGHPVIRNHYPHLRAAGTPPQGALGACLRKWWVILNALLKTHTTWQTQPA